MTINRIIVTNCDRSKYAAVIYCDNICIYCSNFFTTKQQAVTAMVEAWKNMVNNRSALLDATLIDSGVI